MPKVQSLNNDNTSNPSKPGREFCTFPNQVRDRNLCNSNNMQGFARRKKASRKSEEDVRKTMKGQRLLMSRRKYQQTSSTIFQLPIVIPFIRPEIDEKYLFFSQIYYDILSMSDLSQFEHAIFATENSQRSAFGPHPDIACMQVTIFVYDFGRRFRILKIALEDAGPEYADFASLFRTDIGSFGYFNQFNFITQAGRTNVT
uniref:Uncharacterized protein n=1 Tax=Romanomermis culicivorax TaxID=13658 RepID=A0A915JTB4_ROMCU